MITLQDALKNKILVFLSKQIHFFIPEKPFAGGEVSLLQTKKII